MASSTDDECVVLVLQDVTGSYFAEISDARDANHTLLNCLQLPTRVRSLVRMLIFTGVVQDDATLVTTNVGYNSLSAAINGLDSCGKRNKPECSGIHVGAGMGRALETFADADTANPVEKKRPVAYAAQVVGGRSRIDLIP